MGFDLADLVACLGLRTMGDDSYEGESYDFAYPRLFGGQVLAQGVSSLHLSGAGKTVKSFTQHFPREGRGGTPVDYRVDTVHDGRAFATCSVTATQGDRTVGVMSASLHHPEHGFERSDAPPVVCPPDEAVLMDLRILPWEVRVVDGIDLDDRTTRPPTYQFWMRVPALPDLLDAEQTWVHQALLAHSADPTVIGTALLPVEGVSQADANVKFASAVTSQTMYFHAPFRIDDWVLVDQHSPILSAGRAFGRADVWTLDGRLVASMAQESMVRVLKT